MVNKLLKDVFVFSGLPIPLPVYVIYSETCVNRSPSKRAKNGFQDQLSLNELEGQKY